MRRYHLIATLAADRAANQVPTVKPYQNGKLPPGTGGAGDTTLR